MTYVGYFSIYNCLILDDIQIRFLLINMVSHDTILIYVSNVIHSIQRIADFPSLDQMAPFSSEMMLSSQN